MSAAQKAASALFSFASLEASVTRTSSRELAAKVAQEIRSAVRTRRGAAPNSAKCRRPRRTESAHALCADACRRPGQCPAHACRPRAFAPQPTCACRAHQVVQPARRARGRRTCACNGTPRWPRRARNVLSSRVNKGIISPKQLLLSNHIISISTCLLHNL